MKFYAEKFKKLRSLKRFSSKEFCSQLGIVRSTLWEWETGKRIPTESSIRMMADILNIQLCEISDLSDGQDVNATDFSEEVEAWLSLAGADVKLRQSKFDDIIAEINSLNKELNQATVIINALLSSLRSMFYVKDINLNYITANSIFLSNISLNSNFKVFGATDYKFFTQAEAKQNIEEDRLVLLTKQAVINREGYIPGSRKKKWGLISKLPIQDSFGKVAGIVGTFIDITERTKAEEIRSLLETALNNSHHVVWLQYTLPKYNLFYVSESVQSLYGYSAEKFLKEKNFWFNTCVYADDRQHLEPDWVYGKTSTPGKRVFRIVKPDGEVRWIESFLVNTKLHNYIAFIEKDITDRKLNEYIAPEQIISKENIELDIKKQIAAKLRSERVNEDIIRKCTDITFF